MLSSPRRARFRYSIHRVLSKLDLPAWHRAALTVKAEIRNNTDRPVTAAVYGRVAPVVGPHVALAHATVSRPVFDQFPQLMLSAPKVWWPAQFGAQPRYELSLSARAGWRPSEGQCGSSGSGMSAVN